MFNRSCLKFVSIIICLISMVGCSSISKSSSVSTQTILESDLVSSEWDEEELKSIMSKMDEAPLTKSVIVNENIDNFVVETDLKKVANVEVSTKTSIPKRLSLPSKTFDVDRTDEWSEVDIFVPDIIPLRENRSDCGVVIRLSRVLWSKDLFMEKHSTRFAMNEARSCRKEEIRNKILVNPFLLLRSYGE